jgi:hypothetical protein
MKIYQEGQRISGKWFNVPVQGKILNHTFSLATSAVMYFIELDKPIRRGSGDELNIFHRVTIEGDVVLLK